MNKLTEADLDAASSWVRYPATPYNTGNRSIAPRDVMSLGDRIYSTGRVAIGKRYKPAARTQDTTYTEDQVQAALLAWKDSGANDSRILGSSRDLHRVRVGRRSMLWRVMRVARELRQWLLLPRAW